MDDKEKDRLKVEGKCLICKTPGYYARDCPNKKSINSAYNQVQYQSRPPTNPWKMRNLRSAYQQVNAAETTIMRSPTDSRKFLIPQTNRVTNAVKVLINRHEAYVLLDTGTVHENLISNIFTIINKIPVQETEPKVLETVIKGSKSSLQYKTLANVDIQGHKEQIPFYMCNLKIWDTILREPALRAINAVIHTAENRVTIQPKEKPEQELIMIEKEKKLQISTASNYIAPTAETISDYSEAETASMHLQQFLLDWDTISNKPSKSKRQLSPILEESKELDTLPTKKMKTSEEVSQEEYQQEEDLGYEIDLEDYWDNQDWETIVGYDLENQDPYTNDENQLERLITQAQ